MYMLCLMKEQLTTKCLAGEIEVELLSWSRSEEVGHTSSKVTNVSRALAYKHTCMAGISHALLWLMKDAVGKELSEPWQTNLSTLFNPSQISKFWGFVVAQNQSKVSILGFVHLFSLSGFEIRLRKLSLTKSAIEISAGLPYSLN